VNGRVAVRFIHLYLIAYLVFVVGAGLVLWQAGALARVRAIWMTITAGVVIGLGVIFAINSSGPRTISHELGWERQEG